MSWWTEEQDDVLREVSFRGAEYAAAEIERRCGVRHSVRAVEMRASRIHCSLAVQTVCPSCGAVGVKINRQTGMCPLCTERYHLEQERAFNEQLERERAACERSDEPPASGRTSSPTCGASGTRCGSATAGCAGSTGSRGSGSVARR